jgi:carbamoyl-phosphate synthase large subunit
MLGERIADLGLPADPVGDVVCVKEAVMPFDRFAGADSLLGPEMRSTGEVMGIAHDFPTAFAKAQAAAGSQLPERGTVFLTVTDGDKPAAAGVAMALHGLGFRIVATSGTAQAIKRMGIPVEPLFKIGEGTPNVLDLIEAGDVQLVVNTPVGTGARTDGWEIRSAAIARGIPCITTMTGAMAAAQAMASGRRGEPTVISLQELRRVPAEPLGQRPRVPLETLAQGAAEPLGQRPRVPSEELAQGARSSGDGIA